MAHHDNEKKRKHTQEKGSALFKLLSNSTIDDVVPSKHRMIFTLSHSTRLIDALQELSEQRLLSAPVVLSSSIEDGDSDTYMGMIDASAILRAIMEMVLSKAPAEKSRWAELEQLGERVEQRTLITLLADDVQLQYKGEHAHSLLATIREGFLGLGAEHPREVRHRIAVFNDRGHIVNIISQSDVVRYLEHHAKDLGPLADASVESLGFVTNDVVTVARESSAADAFQTMYDRKVSGIAVVDEKGALVGNISASDLRCLHHGHFARLLLPVLDFLAANHARPVHDKDEVYCHASHTLASVLHRLVSAKIHRVYVVSEHHVPVGVITLTDILKLVVARAEEGAEEEA